MASQRIEQKLNSVNLPRLCVTAHERLHEESETEKRMENLGIENPSEVPELQIQPSALPKASQKRRSCVEQGWNPLKLILPLFLLLLLLLFQLLINYFILYCVVLIILNRKRYYKGTCGFHLPYMSQLLSNNLIQIIEFIIY